MPADQIPSARQCKLARTNADSTVSSYMTFIPKQFAHVGKELKIRDDNGWQDGWIVTEVYGDDKGGSAERWAKQKMPE